MSLDLRLELPELRSIDLDGPVGYREWDGPREATFVLVHGLAGSHVNWVLAAPGLAGLGRVLALDLPGFGLSPLAGRGTGLMDHRRVLSRFVGELATGRVVICGNSLGGGIAILQAAVEPATVDGLVLTSSIFPWARGGWPHPLVIGAFAAYDSAVLGERLVGMRTRRMTPARQVRYGFRIVAADPRSIPAEVLRLHEDVLLERGHDPEGVRAFLGAARSLLRLGRRPDVAKRALDGVTCPVLVLHGGRDRFVPAAFARAALERYPRWRGRILPGVGHAPQLEAPDRWVAEVADWFASLPDGARRARP